MNDTCFDVFFCFAVPATIVSLSVCRRQVSSLTTLHLLLFAHAKISENVCILIHWGDLEFTIYLIQIDTIPIQVCRVDPTKDKSWVTLNEMVQVSNVSYVATNDSSILKVNHSIYRSVIRPVCWSVSHSASLLFSLSFSQSVVQSVCWSVSHSASLLFSQSVVQSVIQPVCCSVSLLVSQPFSQSVVQPVCWSVSHSASLLVSQLFSQSVVQSVCWSVSHSASLLVSQSFSQSVGQSVIQPLSWAASCLVG